MEKKKTFKTTILVVFTLVFLISARVYAQVEIAVIDSGSNKQFYKAVSFTSLAADVDYLGHGTKVAQLIKEINPQARIYVLQVCEEINGHYTPSTDAVLKAIQWCMENDIDVVNLSLVIPYDKKIEAAIEQAYRNKKIIFIAAAGNINVLTQFATNAQGYVYLTKPEQGVMFPAASGYVISVGANDARGRIVNFSTKNADVYSQGKYAHLQGTSFACARITAEVAKILFLNPGISLEQLKPRLRMR